MLEIHSCLASECRRKRADGDVMAVCELEHAGPDEGAMQVVGAAGSCWEKSWAACRVFQHPDADGRSAASAADASRTCGCSVWLKSRVSSFRKNCRVVEIFEKIVELSKIGSATEQQHS